jgi:predicted membrane chloride channel (bestrophin family)
MWFQEFLTRESLSGSTGAIPGAILSRLYQFTSDGVAGYNHARKVAYVPFPFPHAQITAVFSVAIMFIFPLLYFEYINSLVFSCVLNFATVLCFLGVHEVARELENPFVNVPNDIPLTTFQAQFNEALVTFYAGYHPDAWWEVTPEEAPVL